MAQPVQSPEISNCEQYACVEYSSFPAIFSVTEDLPARDDYVQGVDEDGVDAAVLDSRSHRRRLPKL